MTMNKTNLNFRTLSIIIFIVIITFLFKERYDMVRQNIINQDII